MVIIDFETYSPVPIDAGSVKYSQHHHADIVLLGYKIDDEPTQIWYPWEGLEAIELIKRNAPIYAHNALFDFCAWNYIGAENYNFPRMPLTYWRDTLALCNRYTLPNKLADVGSILNVSVQKDRRGTALIKKICVSANGQRPKHGVHYTNQDLQDFADYCKQDVDSTYELLKVLPAKSLSESEQYYWELTQNMNLRGLPIDTEAIEKILAYIEGYAEEMTQRVPELTNGAVEKATQVKRIVDWLKTRGIKVTNLRADTVDRLLASEVPDDVYEMLELRQILGRSSTAKYNALALMEHNGRIYNNLQYHGANTGRWTGRGFQMHNLPRASVPDPEEQVERFKTFLPVDKPVATAKALIRSMIWAPPKRMLMVSDYSSIEYHLLCWVSGDDDAVEAAFNHVDAYVDMAAHLYGKAHSAVSKGERQMGKVIILGCGYGMGAEKFQEVCASWGIIITLPEAQIAVDAYRAKYYKVKKLWYTLKDCAVAAVRHKGKTFSYQNCHFKCVKDHTGREWLKLLLPSGRALFYMEPYVESAKYGWSIGHMGMNSHSKKWSRLWLSPGRITENIIQALGSDVMRVGLKAVEENMPGVFLIGTVHDEAISVLLEEDAFQDTLETFNKHLCTTEDWNNGMYLRAEGYFSKRYKKG